MVSDHFSGVLAKRGGFSKGEPVKPGQLAEGLRRSGEADEDLPTQRGEASRHG
jgi:hypothetical protein